MSQPESPLSAAEERWLERVLDRASDVDALGEGTGDQEAEQRLWLARAKSTLGSTSEREWSGVHEGALVARIFAATSREDLGWRGELHLVGTFLHERLRQSMLLRVVAASLALHLVALPVVAYWVGRRAPKPVPYIVFDPHPAADFSEQPEDSPAPPSDPISIQEGLLLPAQIDNALRRSRYVLSRASGPELPEVQVHDSLERKLVIGRSAFLGERSWQPWWNETNLWSSASGLARVLWVELLLDAYVLEGRRSSDLGIYLAELERAPDASDASDADRMASTLRVQVLDRARMYGLLRAPAGFDPGAQPEPLGSAWLQQVRAAAVGSTLLELLEDSALGGWVAR